MLKVNKNHLKSLILAILIITSLLQVGFLWDYQNYGIPLSFLSGILGRAESYDDNDLSGIIKDDLFIPDMIVISNGNETHWKISRHSSEWKKITGDTIEYLRTAYSGREGSSVNVTDWNDIILRKGIKIDFGRGINLELLHWILGLRFSDGNINEVVRKIAFLPDDDINNNNTMYVLTSERLTKYVVPFIREGFTNRDLAVAISNLERNTGLISYKYFAEIDPNEVISKRLPFFIPRDYLSVVYGERFDLFHHINYDIDLDTYNIEELAQIIVGSEKESYDRYVEKGATVFRNINNTYRVNNDGFLEYRYLSSVFDQDKTDIGSALEIAYLYIMRVSKQLGMNDSDFMLKSVNSSNSAYYELTFDYSVDGLPVYLDSGKSSNMQKPYQAAITVRANSRRILELRWHLLKIEKSRFKRQFNIYFTDMLDDFSEKYKNEDYFHTEGIKQAYLVNDMHENTFTPVWIMDDYNEFRYVYLKER